MKDSDPTPPTGAAPQARSRSRSAERSRSRNRPRISRSRSRSRSRPRARADVKGPAFVKLAENIMKPPKHCYVEFHILQISDLHPARWRNRQDMQGMKSVRGVGVRSPAGRTARGKPYKARTFNNFMVWGKTAGEALVSRESQSPGGRHTSIKYY